MQSSQLLPVIKNNIEKFYKHVLYSVLPDNEVLRTTCPLESTLLDAAYITSSYIYSWQPNNIF